MSKTEIIVLSLLIVAIVAIAISALCYVKNKQRYILPFSQNSKYLSNFAFEIDKEIRKIIDECYKKTEDIIKNNI